MSDQELSESGSPIYRYDNVEPNKFTPPSGEGENLEAISDHIEKCVGPIDSVFHEIISDQVHIDVHWVRPTADFPYHTLVTSGMSDKPMNVPPGLEGFRYAELCVFLPESWPIDGTNFKLMEEIFKEEKYYWPVRWLKTIARFPHEYNTWVGYGHTVPNGENADPFAENTRLGCMLLLPSLFLGKDFYELEINKEKSINFYCLIPIYKEEMNFKLKNGLDALVAKFDENKVSDVIDINRPNTCAKKGLFGKW